jgi:hypothetical protein
MNNNIDELMEKIKSNITDSYKRLKRELFENSGKILGHNWVDLTPKYKDDKRKKYGFTYPVGIATGALLEGVMEKMLVVDVFYNEFEDKIDFNFDVDTDRIGLDYADKFNEFKNRNFVKFTDDEQKIFYNIVANTIQDYFRGAAG